MKTCCVPLLILALVLPMSAGATLIPIDISPAAGAALNPVNYVNGDHTLGLSAPNAVGQPASSATGNEIGGGIFFDDVTKILTYDLGYGSDFGFVDLVGTYSVAHIHGPAAVQFPAPNVGAGVVAALSHTPGSGASTGSFSGSVILTPTQEADLFNNLHYINIHSSFAGGGEIRGQLVPVIPEPATLALFLVGLAGLLRQRRR